MKDLQAKVAVVTGAASGIGFALAERFSREGMKVVLADVEAKSLEAAVTALRDGGAEATGVVCDVSQPSSVEALAAETRETYGACHVLCNNAGVFAGGTLWESPLEDFEWVLNVNLWGVLHGVRAFVPAMLEQGDECHIVNTASMAGVTTTPFVSAYNVSKHGVVALSECLYHELVATGSKIRVSVLCPEMIHTRIHESGRNRPEHLKADSASPATEVVNQAISAGVSGGLPPSVMADRVVTAIRNEQFYILCEDKGWRDACDTRLEDVRLARNPTLVTPGL